jgi:sulfur relay protein TusB/DsrH
MKDAAVNKKCLHLVVKSSAEALDRARAQFEKGDALLFLDDGVVHIMSDFHRSLEPPLSACYFAQADLAARGLSVLALDEAFPLVSDREIVELMLAFEHCLTWK